MADQHDDVEDLKAANAVELHRTVREEGEDELNRPTAALFWSGLAAGLAISSSLLAEAALHGHVPAGPARELIVSLGYPIGFLVVILGRMQLFTESTVTAMLPLATRPTAKALGRTMRLWGIVLGANLLGTFVAAGLMGAGVLGDDALRAAAVRVAEPILELDAWHTFLNAIPAGFLIAIIAWVLPNARQQAFLVIFAITYVISICGFSHSVVGAGEAFLLMFTKHATPLQAAFGLIAPAVLGNLVGGAGLFAVLAHAQVRSDVEDKQPDDE